MSAYNRNRPCDDRTFPCLHPETDALERCCLVSRIAQVSYNVLSVFLTPFYCIGLVLKSILHLILNLLKIVFSLIVFWRFPNDKPLMETVLPAVVGDAGSCGDKVRAECGVDKVEKHSKLIACPNCEHLHYSARYCKCRACQKVTPRLLECFKYHKNEAQVLMCPCVDCKHKRPMSEMCEHCVLVSQKLHVQAKSPEDIEIKTRPKRRK